MMMANQAKLSDMLTVTVTRDAWDWLVAVATLIVAPLSLIALVVGFRALYQDNVLASNADDALVRERRSTFELAILARILELCALSLGPPMILEASSRSPRPDPVFPSQEAALTRCSRQQRQSGR